MTIIFSTHVIAHAERLCERIAIIAKGKVASTAASTRRAPGCVRSFGCAPARATAHGARPFPPSARRDGEEWVFELPEGGPEPLLRH